MRTLKGDGILCKPTSPSRGGSDKVAGGVVLAGGVVVLLKGGVVMLIGI